MFFFLFRKTFICDIFRIVKTNWKVYTFRVTDNAIDYTSFMKNDLKNS